MARTESHVPVARVFYILASVLMVLACLYFGQAVLIPVALSVLLAFVLTPLVNILERWHLGRVGAVLVATGLAFGLIAIAGWALVSQVQTLAADLPNHKTEIKAKIASLKMGDESTLSRLSNLVREVFPSEEDQAVLEATGETSDELAPAIAETAPTKIVVAAEESNGLATAAEVILPIVEPLATAALVIVLVMFLLIRREDVRYRMISLMGDAALTGTTRLMGDTAERVSKYLLYLLLVNAGFGLWFGVGLYLMDVPYAPLWGFLTLCFRFIPFLGSPASVLFPLLISIATSSGWGQPAAVLGFFLISELVTANVIEPVLFGKTTGLTPIALLIAALFWAWIWGPIGLLLSTPLTVCLVVLGQHLPHLRSLKVLLAEQPVLDARLQYFQRLLAGDANEGSRVFQQYLDEFGETRAYDEVLLPALGWTRRERLKESITAAEEQFIWRATRDAVIHSQDVPVAMQKVDANKDSDQDDADHPAQDAAQPPAMTYRVHGYPVHHESEEIALDMLRQLQPDGTLFTQSTTKQLPSRVISEIETDPPDVIVVAVMPPGGLPQVRFICSEFHRRCPRTPIIIAYFGHIKDYDDLLVNVRKVGASYLTTSLAQTNHQIEMLRADALESSTKRGSETETRSTTPTAIANDSTETGSADDPENEVIFVE